MAAHLAPIRLDELLIADIGIDLELRITFCQRAGLPARMSAAQRRLHIRKLERRQPQALGYPDQYPASRRGRCRRRGARPATAYPRRRATSRSAGRTIRAAARY